MQKPSMEMSWRSGPWSCFVLAVATAILAGWSNPVVPKWLGLPPWRAMLEIGFTEAIVASCQFGSIHQKEFRFAVYLVDPSRLQCRWNGWGRHMSRSKAVSQSHQLPMSKDWASTLRRTLEWTSRVLAGGSPIGQESLISNDVLATSIPGLSIMLPFGKARIISTSLSQWL